MPYCVVGGIEDFFHVAGIKDGIEFDIVGLAVIVKGRKFKEVLLRLRGSFHGFWWEEIVEKGRSL